MRRRVSGCLVENTGRAEPGGGRFADLCSCVGRAGGRVLFARDGVGGPDRVDRGVAAERAGPGAVIAFGAIGGGCAGPWRRVWAPIAGRRMLARVGGVSTGRVPGVGHAPDRRGGGGVLRALRVFRGAGRDAAHDGVGVGASGGGGTGGLTVRDVAPRRATIGEMGKRRLFAARRTVVLLPMATLGVLVRSS